VPTYPVITPGSETQLYTSAAMTAQGWTPGFPDGALEPIPTGSGNFRFTTSDGGTSSSGSADNFDRNGTLTTPLTGASTNGHVSITGIPGGIDYHAGGCIYIVPGFSGLIQHTHCERWPGGILNRFWGSLGFVVSADNGATWHWGGEIIQHNTPYIPNGGNPPWAPLSGSANDYLCEIGGGPTILLNDGYAYTYFDDVQDSGVGTPGVLFMPASTNWLSCARALITDIAAAANATINGTPTAPTFTKYYSGSFSQPALCSPITSPGGLSTALETSNPAGYVSSASIHIQTNTIVITGMAAHPIRPPTNASAYIIQSFLPQTGLGTAVGPWSSRQIMSGPWSGGGAEQPIYISIASDISDGTHKISNSGLRLYFLNWPAGGSVTGLNTVPITFDTSFAQTVYYDDLVNAGSRSTASNFSQTDSVNGVAFADNVIRISNGIFGATFSISPTGGHALGAVTITATGVRTTWTNTNPFTVTVGGSFATISNYQQSGSGGTATSRTFTLNLTSNGGTVTISDSNSGTTQNYTAASVAPTAPIIGTLTDNHNGTATVTFSPPTDNGGSPILSYTATDSAGGSNTGSGSPIIITYTTYSVSQTVSVTATNTIGTGPASSASNSITPLPSFTILPIGATSLGVKSLTATGFGTTWNDTNPFSISSGPANNLTNYQLASGGGTATSRTFTITVTALSGGPVVIHDSNSGTNFNFTIFQAIPPVLYWYQLYDGTLVSEYYHQFDTTLRELCAANGVTPPSASWISTGTGTTFSDWDYEVDVCMRTLCTLLSVAPMIPLALGETTGQYESDYIHQRDTVLRALCVA
jgi:hypothetical protein